MGLVHLEKVTSRDPLQRIGWLLENFLQSLTPDLEKLCFRSMVHIGLTIFGRTPLRTRFMAGSTNLGSLP